LVRVLIERIEKGAALATVRPFLYANVSLSLPLEKRGTFLNASTIPYWCNAMHKPK